jgi:ribosome-binding protein aMBF1 (putative translation factor)
MQSASGRHYMGGWKRPARPQAVSTPRAADFSDVAGQEDAAAQVEEQDVRSSVRQASGAFLRDRAASCRRGRPPSRPLARAARALIEAGRAAGLSQSQLAKKMKTSQSYIARIEGGTVRPSTDALERFAQATRTRLRIVFEPHATR